MTKYALTGDVGSTNVCLVLCDIVSGEVSQAKAYSGFDYPSLGAAIRVYPEEYKVEMRDSCIAIACPITSDWVIMINHTWAFSIAETKKNLGFSHLEVINDSTAVLMAVLMLKEEHLIRLDGVEPVEGKSIAAYGAGTGLGVAYLVHVDKRWVGLLGKGGHVDFAPNSEEEVIIPEILHVKIGHIPAERVLSGPGLVDLYCAIAKADNRLPENPKPEDITERALADSCIDCRRALSLLCVIMGRSGSSLTLTLGTFGGVHIADGIVPCFLEFFEASGFRATFEDKGRFRECVHDIPVYLIAHNNPGLLGSDAHLRQTLGHILQILPVISGGNSPDNLLNHTVNSTFFCVPSQGRPAPHFRTAGLILW